MARKAKTTEEHLEVIENLLVGVLLNRKPTVRELAKILGVSDKRITEMYPKKSAGEITDTSGAETEKPNDQQTTNENTP